MQVNYTKLLIVEGLLRQVMGDENKCVLTLKNRDNLDETQNKLNEILDYFESGDFLENVEGVTPDDQERSFNFADKILDEIQRLSWEN